MTNIDIEKRRTLMGLATLRVVYCYAVSKTEKPELYEGFDIGEIDAAIGGLVGWKRTDDPWADLDRWCRIIGGLYLDVVDYFESLTPGGALATYALNSGAYLSKGCGSPPRCEASDEE